MIFIVEGFPLLDSLTTDSVLPRGWAWLWRVGEIIAPPRVYTARSDVGYDRVKG